MKETQTSTSSTQYKKSDLTLGAGSSLSFLLLYYPTSLPPPSPFPDGPLGSSCQPLFSTIAEVRKPVPSDPHRRDPSSSPQEKVSALLETLWLTRPTNTRLLSLNSHSPLLVPGSYLLKPLPSPLVGFCVIFLSLCEHTSRHRPSRASQHCPAGEPSPPLFFSLSPVGQRKSLPLL